jgi:hypothetical protein
LVLIQVPLGVEEAVAGDQGAQPEEGVQVRLARPRIRPQLHQHLSMGHSSLGLRWC